MESTPLISVIVPVYKVQQYLDRCVQSIVSQSYSCLEIILVDDGSPDCCGDICDNWAARDSRIKVIHKKNGGLSDARNAGMAVAAGELIGFVDSDDWISSEMYRLLYENMLENGSDIAACGVEMVWEDGTPSRMLTAPGCYNLSAQEAMQAIIEESLLKQPVWYKLYKTSVICDIPFATGKCHEDVFWSYQAIGAANRVSVMDAPCYYYTQRKGSIMDEGFSLKRLDALDAKYQRLKYIERNFPVHKELAERELFMFCLWAEQMNYRYLSGAERKRCENKIRHIWSQVKRVPAQTPKEWVWMMLARLSLSGTARFRTMLGVGM
jgi:glycosyltransferase involved in cell wall biosynthesis